jgi:hypothetical protein
LSCGEIEPPPQGRDPGGENDKVGNAGGHRYESD